MASPPPDPDLQAALALSMQTDASPKQPPPIAQAMRNLGPFRPMPMHGMVVMPGADHAVCIAVPAEAPAVQQPTPAPAGSKASAPSFSSSSPLTQRNYDLLFAAVRPWLVDDSQIRSTLLGSSSSSSSSSPTSSSAPPSVAPSPPVSRNCALAVLNPKTGQLFVKVLTPAVWATASAPTPSKAIAVEICALVLALPPSDRPTEIFIPNTETLRETASALSTAGLDIPCRACLLSLPLGALSFCPKVAESLATAAAAALLYFTAYGEWLAEIPPQAALLRLFLLLRCLSLEPERTKLLIGARPTDNNNLWPTIPHKDWLALEELMLEAFGKAHAPLDVKSLSPSQLLELLLGAENPALLAALVDMGFPKNRAEKALLATGNTQLENAAEWLLTHMNDADIDLALPVLAAPKNPTAPPSREIKMVLVVRQDLGMSMGKAAAQCSHAAVGLFRILLRDHPDYLQRWERHGETKVVLQGKDDAQLAQLQQKAREVGLPSCIIADAGRTEIAPGTRTVLAIAGPIDTVNLVTGNLRLLK